MRWHCWRACVENKSVALTVGAIGGSGVHAANPNIFRLATALLLACCLIGGIAAATGLPDTIDRIRTSIVGVGTVKKDLRRVETTFSGTGFVVADGTLIVTNYHVYKAIAESRAPHGDLAVFSGRGQSAKVHKVMLEGADKDHDLALLRLLSGRLPPMRLAGDGLVREGKAVAFTGFPIGVTLGLYPVTHRGMVSAITPVVIPVDSARRLTPEQIRRIRNRPFDVYQLDGTAYPGSSGSPVYLPDSGEVVAVINSVFVKGTKEAALEAPSGISYAIPVRYVHRLLRAKESG